jgi:hypothetical protein
VITKTNNYLPEGRAHVCVCAFVGRCLVLGIYSVSKGRYVGGMILTGKTEVLAQNPCTLCNITRTGMGLNLCLRVE